MAWIWRFSLLFPWLSALAAGPEVISLNDLTDLRVCAPNILRLTRRFQPLKFTVCGLHAPSIRVVMNARARSWFRMFR